MKQTLGIQAWCQPNGRGYGWAVRRGTADETTRYAVYVRKTGEIVGWRRTKIEALELAKRMQAVGVTRR